MQGCTPRTGACPCLLRAGHCSFPVGRRDRGTPRHRWERVLRRCCPQGCRLHTLPSIAKPPFSPLGKKTCLEPRKETRGGGGLSLWAWQSSDLHQDLRVTSPSLPWGRVPAPDTSTQRTHFPRWLRGKGPFPGRGAHTGGSHTTPPAITAPSPAHRQIKPAPLQWGTGTIWKGFPFLLSPP